MEDTVMDAETTKREETWVSQTLRIPVPTVKITAAMEVHGSLDLACGEPDIQQDNAEKSPC